MKIKVKMTLIMLFVALVPLLISISIISYTYGKYVQESTLESSLGKLRAASNDLSGYFGERLSEVSTIANEPLVKSLDWTQIRPYFRDEVVRHGGVYEKIIISLPDSSYYSTTKDEASGIGNSYQGGKMTKNNSDPNSAPLLLSSRDYWKKMFILNTEKKPLVFISEPVISLSTGVKQILALSAIMDDNGELIGAVQGGIPWEEISGEVNSVKAAMTPEGESNAKVALIAPQGDYIDHWDTSKIVNIKMDAAGNAVLDEKGQKTEVRFKVTEEPSAGLREAGLKMVAGEEGYSFYIDSETNQEMVVLYSPVKSAGYVFMMVIPKSDILAPVTNLIGALFLLALLCGIIAVTIGLVSTTYLVRPITELTKAGKRIADGDLSAKIPEIKTSDEIQDLSLTIEMLSGALKTLKGEQDKKKK